MEVEFRLSWVQDEFRLSSGWVQLFCTFSHLFPPKGSKTIWNAQFWLFNTFPNLFPPKWSKTIWNAQFSSFQTFSNLFPPMVKMTIIYLCARIPYFLSRPYRFIQLDPGTRVKGSEEYCQKYGGKQSHLAGFETEVDYKAFLEMMGLFPKTFVGGMWHEKAEEWGSLADLGGACWAHATPYGTQFFCFHIHFHQKLPVSGVHAPLTGPCPPTENPGSATGGGGGLEATCKLWK